MPTSEALYITVRPARVEVDVEVDAAIDELDADEPPVEAAARPLPLPESEPPPPDTLAPAPDTLALAPTGTSGRLLLHVGLDRVERKHAHVLHNASHGASRAVVPPLAAALSAPGLLPADTLLDQFVEVDFCSRRRTGDWHRRARTSGAHR